MAGVSKTLLVDSGILRLVAMLSTMELDVVLTDVASVVGTVAEVVDGTVAEVVGGLPTMKVVLGSDSAVVVDSTVLEVVASVLSGTPGLSATAVVWTGVSGNAVVVDTVVAVDDCSFEPSSLLELSSLPSSSFEPSVSGVAFDCPAEVVVAPAVAVVTGVVFPVSAAVVVVACASPVLLSSSLPPRRPLPKFPTALPKPSRRPAIVD